MLKKLFSGNHITRIESIENLPSLNVQEKICEKIVIVLAMIIITQATFSKDAVQVKEEQCWKLAKQALELTNQLRVRRGACKGSYGSESGRYCA